MQARCALEVCAAAPHAHCGLLRCRRSTASLCRRARRAGPLAGPLGLHRRPPSAVTSSRHPPARPPSRRRTRQTPCACRARCRSRRKVRAATRMAQSAARCACGASPRLTWERCPPWCGAEREQCRKYNRGWAISNPDTWQLSVTPDQLSQGYAGCVLKRSNSTASLVRERGATGRRAKGPHACRASARRHTRCQARTHTGASTQADRRPVAFWRGSNTGASKGWSAEAITQLQARTGHNQSACLAQVLLNKCVRWSCGEESVFPRAHCVEPGSAWASLREWERACIWLLTRRV